MCQASPPNVDTLSREQAGCCIVSFRLKILNLKEIYVNSLKKKKASYERVQIEKSAFLFTPKASGRFPREITVISYTYFYAYTRIGAYFFSDGIIKNCSETCFFLYFIYSEYFCISIYVVLPIFNNCSIH